MTYCIEVWGGMSKTYMSSLYKIKKKLFTSLLPATAHSAPIFHELKNLPIEKLYLLFVNLFMYKFVYLIFLVICLFVTKIFMIV